MDPKQTLRSPRGPSQHAELRQFVADGSNLGLWVRFLRDGRQERIFEIEVLLLLALKPASGRFIVPIAFFLT